MERRHIGTMEHLSPRNHFFSLLKEMEAAVDRGDIAWSEEDVLKATARLTGLVLRIGRIVDPNLGRAP